MYSLPGPSSPCTQTHHGAQTCTFFPFSKNIISNLVDKQIRQIEARIQGGGAGAGKGRNNCYPYLVPKFNPEKNICKKPAKNEQTESTSLNISRHNFRSFIVQIFVHQVLGNGDLVMQVIFAL